LGTTVINQNLIQEEIKSRLNLDNVFYHSVQNLSSSLLLPKNIRIILPVVQYRCGTCSLILREEHRLRACENRVLRRIFGPRREEVIGGWRKLHNPKLHNLYSLTNIIRIMKSRRIRWAEHVVHMGNKRSIYRILVGKPYGKKLLGKPIYEMKL
jgi:hypothetical protein